MSYRERFGERLQGYRKIAGLKQDDLGALVGVSTSCICQYERGKRIPNIERVSMMAQALDVTLDDLVPKARLRDISDPNQMSLVIDEEGE